MVMPDNNVRCQWDPISLTYSAEDKERELPLRLLVLGRFSAQPTPLENIEPTPVTRASLDAVLRELAPTLSLTVADRLLPDAGARVVRIPLQGLADFGPDRLIEQVPELKAVLALIEQLRSGQAPTAPQLTPMLITLGWQEGREADDLWRDYAIAELYLRLGQQLDELLHHRDFQALEANWRALALIAGQLGDGQECRLDILDLDKSALQEDFRGHPNADETLLYRTLYTREFGQYGGEPYTAVLAAYAFGPGAADIELLRDIAGVAAAAHAPFIADAGPDFFELGRFEMLSDTSSLPDIQRGPRFAKWRSFLSEDATRYIALLLPRLLVRVPYDYRSGSVGARVGALAYRENISRRHTDCLWGSAALGFAGCLIRSYQRFRICVDVVGPVGGRLEGLPRTDDKPWHPTEIQLTERKEAELSELGFMPIAVARAHGYSGFNSAHSIHWGAIEPSEARRNDKHSLGLRLGAQLPYVFLISRIAHYLKVIQRDMLGTVTSPAEMETQLNTWLRRYVSDMENPAAGMRSQRPLRQAQLTVREEGGVYRMHLSVSPHTKHLGADFSLSLDSGLGRPQ